MPDTTLVSMKLKPREKEATDRIYPSMSSTEPEYPWGLQITLEEEQLKALGITALPKVGATVTITARAEICRTAEYDSQGDGEQRSIGLQITEIALGSS